MNGQFSVYQFFSNETYEEVARFVDAETAMRAVVGLVRSIGGKLGTTARVIITDGDDFTTFEWVHGKGVVFPVVETKE